MTALAPRVSRTSSVAISLGAGAGLMWSLGAVTNRLATGTDAFQYLIWRSIGIVVVIEVMARLKRRRSPFVQSLTHGPVMMLGSLGLLVASLGFVYAIKNTSAANASFLSSLTPFVAALYGWVALRERVSRPTIVAMLIGVVGLLIMVSGDLGAGGMDGNVAAVCTSVGFGLYMVCIRSRPSFPWSAALPGYAVPMIIVCATVTLLRGRTVIPSPHDIALALLHGSVFIVIGTLWFNTASISVPSVGMALLAQTETIAVPLLIALWFGERPGPRGLLGAFIILVSLVVNAVATAQPPGPHSIDHDLPEAQGGHGV